MLKITLRELEVFVAISQAGQVTAAGAALGLSQSAMSGAIGELERRLGVTLFDRIGRRVTLNEHGRYLLPRALNMLQQATDLETVYQQGAPSRLKIAASLTIGNYVLPALLAPLMQVANTRYEVEIGNSPAVMKMLLDCKADIGLIEAPLTHSNLMCELWLKDEMVIFCHPDHPLAGTTPSPTELAQCAWILRESGSGVRQSLETMLLPHLGAINVVLELGSGEAIREAIRLNMGISCGSRRAITRELATGTFATIHLKNHALERRFFIVWHAEKQLTAGAERLRLACHQWFDQEQEAATHAT
ncbi:LysR family transcriptional regulator [Deefgea salmonis]|uniref:LysR family transcriptional regulator n=1 Tax=Deefgea salmonis TaxID=2875502 RepID=A0ABS8BGL0_9NEIS|nr:LysR family transcriptional regulator [Deefgea salmonis]MCB5194850.1 LysR family transcriptional regulator [Deefgea salmonis]